MNKTRDYVIFTVIYVTIMASISVVALTGTFQ